MASREVCSQATTSPPGGSGFGGSSFSNTGRIAKLMRSSRTASGASANQTEDLRWPLPPDRSVLRRPERHQHVPNQGDRFVEPFIQYLDVDDVATRATTAAGDLAQRSRLQCVAQGILQFIPRDNPALSGRVRV